MTPAQCAFKEKKRASGQRLLAASDRRFFSKSLMTPSKEQSTARSFRQTCKIKAWRTKSCPLFPCVLDFERLEKNHSHTRLYTTIYGHISAKQNPRQLAKQSKLSGVYLHYDGLRFISSTGRAGCTTRRRLPACRPRQERTGLPAFRRQQDA